MLTIRTIVQKSSTEGLGLFADELIKKGTIVWKFDPRFDIYFTKEEVKSMNQIQQDFLQHFSALSPESGKFILSIYNTRFTNHSATKSNLEIMECGDPETCAVASRDIEVGEELLIDYKTIDSEDSESNEAYLQQ